MADPTPITDQAAVSFVKLKVRPTANILSQAYVQSKKLLAFYAGRDMTAPFAGEADPVADQPAGDAVLVTSANVRDMVTVAAEFVAYLEAKDNAKLFTLIKMADNPG